MPQQEPTCSGTRDSRLWGYYSSDGLWHPVPIDADGNLIVNISAGLGAITIADGADVAEGATTDAAVTGDVAGTVSSKLRGLSKILADVWDSVNNRLKVYIQNATLAVTQSGTWLVGNGLSIPVADYVALTGNSTTDIWTFKTGGSGGTTVTTITVVYTDATKATISTVTKT